MEILADIIGVIGFIILISAYFMLQKGTVEGRDIKYLSMNIIASSCILFSLFWSWNFPSFLIQSFWIAISFYGIWRNVRSKNL